MEQPKIEVTNASEKNEIEQEITIRSVEKEKLDEIMREYEKDSNYFFAKNAFVLWDGGKNPAIMIAIEMTTQFTREIWQEHGLGDPSKLLVDARNAAMFVAKYLGADLDDWCKVDAQTAAKVTEAMGKEHDFKKNCELILEKIKKNDQAFSEFLSRICVRDTKTGELRSEGETEAMVTMVSFITRMMYEQMQKSAGLH